MGDGLNPLLKVLSKGISAQTEAGNSSLWFNVNSMLGRVMASTLLECYAWLYAGYDPTFDMFSDRSSVNSFGL